MPDDFWSDPFHSIALYAFAEVMAESGQNPPDSEAVRRRAFKYHEQQKRQEYQSASKVGPFMPLYFHHALAAMLEHRQVSIVFRYIVAAWSSDDDHFAHQSFSCKIAMTTSVTNNRLSRSSD